jgi:hypothetical protein
MLNVQLILILFLQLLLILTAVQFVGAIASISNVSELWAIYCVLQGIQVCAKEKTFYL